MLVIGKLEHVTHAGSNPVLTAKNIKMRRVIKSKIEYFSILNPAKIIKAWNKNKAAKKIKTEINNIREK